HRPYRIYTAKNNKVQLQEAGQQGAYILFFAVSFPMTGNELLIMYEILLQFFMDSRVPCQHAVPIQDADLFTKQVCRDTTRFSQDDHACGVIPWVQSEEKSSTYYALGGVYKIQCCRTVGTRAPRISYDFGERTPDPFFDHPVRIECNE